MAGPPCSVALVIDTLEQGERELFELVLDSPRVSKSEIARALRSAGHPVSGWSLRHHSRGECKCFSTT